jgi:hypothetical protein
MPAFGSWIKTQQARAKTFFGSSLPNAARNSVRFINGTLIPSAQRAHRVISDVNETLQKDPTLQAKYKEKSKELSRLSNIGLTKLNEHSQRLTNVSRAAGLVIE